MCNDEFVLGCDGEGADQCGLCLAANNYCRTLKTIPASTIQNSDPMLHTAKWIIIAYKKRPAVDLYVVQEIFCEF